MQWTPSPTSAQRRRCISIHVNMSSEPGGPAGLVDVDHRAGDVEEHDHPGRAGHFVDVQRVDLAGRSADESFLARDPVVRRAAPCALDDEAGDPAWVDAVRRRGRREQAQRDAGDLSAQNVPMDGGGVRTPARSERFRRPNGRESSGPAADTLPMRVTPPESGARKSRCLD